MSYWMECFESISNECKTTASYSDYIKKKSNEAFGKALDKQIKATEIVKAGGIERQQMTKEQVLEELQFRRSRRQPMLLSIAEIDICIEAIKEQLLKEYMQNERKER